MKELPFGHTEDENGDPGCTGGLGFSRIGARLTGTKPTLSGRGTLWRSAALCLVHDISRGRGVFHVAQARLRFARFKYTVTIDDMTEGPSFVQGTPSARMPAGLSRGEAVVSCSGPPFLPASELSRHRLAPGAYKPPLCIMN
jgi:hypothetical protein